MTGTATLHGGLVFLDRSEPALDLCCGIVTETMGRRGHRVEAITHLSETQTQVRSARFVMRLRVVPPPCDDADAPARLVLTLDAADLPPDQIREAEILLAVTQFRLAEACQADYVEWLSPETALPVEKFRSAFRRIAPRRVRHGVVVDAHPSAASATSTGQTQCAPRLAPLQQERALAVVFRDEEAAGRAPAGLRRALTRALGLLGALLSLRRGSRGRRFAERDFQLKI